MRKRLFKRLETRALARVQGRPAGPSGSYCCYGKGHFVSATRDEKEQPCAGWLRPGDTFVESDLEAWQYMSPTQRGKQTKHRVLAGGEQCRTAPDRIHLEVDSPGRRWCIPALSSVVLVTGPK